MKKLYCKPEIAINDECRDILKISGGENGVWTDSTSGDFGADYKW